MSYTIEYHERGRHGTTHIVWERNMTSNVKEMLDYCEMNLLQIDGITGALAYTRFLKTIGIFVDNREAVEALAPDNGWGTYDQCYDFLKACLGILRDIGGGREGSGKALNNIVILVSA